MRKRECLNDCRIFNIDTNEWRLFRGMGEIIEARRNHSAVIVGK